MIGMSFLQLSKIKGRKDQLTSVDWHVDSCLSYFRSLAFFDILFFSSFIVVDVNSCLWPFLISVGHQPSDIEKQVRNLVQERKLLHPLVSSTNVDLAKYESLKLARQVFSNSKEKGERKREAGS